MSKINRLVKTMLSFVFAAVLSISGMLTTVNAAEITGTFYYQITRDMNTTYAVGTYVYISTQANLEDPDFQSLTFPGILSACLEISGPTQVGDRGMDVYPDGGYRVNIINKAAGFDSCTTGFIYYNDAQNAWYYFCSGGGVVNRGPYYMYTVGTYDFTSSQINVSAKTDPTGNEIFNNEMIDVSINIIKNGATQAITLKQDLFSFTDNRLNSDSNDFSIHVNVGGVQKEKLFNNLAVTTYSNAMNNNVLTSSNLDRYYAPQQDEIRGIINDTKNKLANATSQANVDQILSDSNKAIEAVKTKSAMDVENANQWKQDYNDTLSLKYINDKDITNIDAALKAYDDLETGAQAMLANEKALLDKMKKMALWNETYHDILNKQGTITSSDLEAINLAYSAFDKYSLEEKALIDPAMIADLEAKKQAAQWDQAHQSIITKKGYIYKSDMNEVNAALDAYDALSHDAQLYVNDQKAILDAKKLAAEWNTAFDAIIEKKTAMNDSDISAIEAALQAYNNMSLEAKAYIDPTYINDLNAKLLAANWDRTHEAIIDKTTPVTDSDINAIKNALQTYDAMNNTEKAYVSSAVIAELKAKYAAANWDKTHEFIIDKTTFVNDADRDAIQAALNAYDAMSDSEKAFVNPAVIADLKAKLTAADWNVTHAEMIDKTTFVNEADKDAIQAALEAYDAMSASEKAFVNPDVIADLKAKLAAAVWNDTFHTMIDQPYVNDKDIEALENALLAYQALTPAEQAFIDPVTIANLNAKLVAAKWDQAYSGIIDRITSFSDADITDLEQVLNAFYEMSAEEQACIDPTIIADLKAKLAAANWDKIFGNIIDSKQTVTNGDLETIEKALAAFDALSDEEKAYIDEAVIADLKAKLAAADWNDRFNNINNKDQITDRDIKAIEEAIKAYEALNDEEKAYVGENYITDLQNKLKAAKFYAEYKKYLSADQLHVSALGDVNKALNAYHKLPKEIQDLLGLSFKEALLDTQDELAFLSKHVGTGDNTNVYVWFIMMSCSLAFLVMRKRKIA